MSVLVGVLVSVLLVVIVGVSVDVLVRVSTCVLVSVLVDCKLNQYKTFMRLPLKEPPTDEVALPWRLLLGSPGEGGAAEGGR